MTRKGLLAEILSKARHYDNCENYRVGYRDYEQILEVSLSEFLDLSENFEKIPAGRIYFVKRNGNLNLLQKISVLINSMKSGKLGLQKIIKRRFINCKIL